jgi:lysine 6-dehydrogenase
MKIMVAGGAGAMGRATVTDLVSQSDVEQVIIGDLNIEEAEKFAASFNAPKVSACKIDITDQSSLANGFAGVDTVVNASWYEYNIEIMKGCLETDCNYVDLGGLYNLTLEQLKLHQAFKDAGLIGCLGLGAAPGMTNILAMHGAAKMDKVDEVHMRTGSTGGKGFAYSPKTVLDECTMNPIMYLNGDLVTLEPLSGKQKYRMPDPVGEVEGFYSIHSELATVPFNIPGVKTVTFRVAFSQKLVDMVQTLLTLDHASNVPIEIKGIQISPREVLDRVLGAKPVVGYVEEYKSLQVEVKGYQNGTPINITYETLVESDKKLDLKGSAIWTGFPAAIVALMIGRKQIKATGVLPAELAVEPEFFISELSKRNIVISEHISAA